MKRELELKYRKILHQQLITGRITEKKFKKEMKVIKNIKKDENKRRNQRTDYRIKL
jgi:hypothetical protein